MSIDETQGAMVEYILFGSMKGKSGKFMGQTFVKGRAMVPKDVHMVVGHVLKQDYAAMPLFEYNEQERKANKGKAETVTVPAVKLPEGMVTGTTKDEDLPEGVSFDEPSAKKGKK